MHEGQQALYSAASFAWGAVGAILWPLADQAPLSQLFSASSVVSLGAFDCLPFSLPGKRVILIESVVSIDMYDNVRWDKSIKLVKR